MDKQQQRCKQVNRKKPPPARVDHIQPIVKITVSPNTPSPEPHEDSDSDNTSVYSGSDVAGGTAGARSCSSSRTHHHSLSSKSCQDNKNNKANVNSENSSAEGRSQSQSWNDMNFYSQNVPVCIDFGIQDYLCHADEAELDMSSDTDTSYLGATPPHRFSDGEIDPIEAMPVLLDTQLNMEDDGSSLMTLGMGMGMSVSNSSTTPASLETTVQSDIPLKTTFNWRETNFQKFLAKSLSKESLISLQISQSSTNNPANDPPQGPGLGSSHITFNKMKTLQDSHSQPHPHPHHRHGLPRPFRRNISLPAAIFKSYLIEIEQSNSNSNQLQNQLKNQNQNIPSSLFKRKFSDHSAPISFCASEDDPLASSSLKTLTGARLDKSDSISNSSQINLFDDSTDKSVEGSSGDSTASFDRVSTEVQEDTGSNWNISNSIDSEVEDQPFTSELEKRSLIIRHMRRLIRQDTSGNFAPPDYHI